MAAMDGIRRLIHRAEVSSAGRWVSRSLRQLSHRSGKVRGAVHRRASPAIDDASANLEKLLQQTTRIRTADGKEIIRGKVVGEFAPGERQVTLYIVFCPPFELLPQVEATAADEIEATVKLVQVLHNGAQLEVRLPEPAEDRLAVAVEFVARQI
jgi:hypothetical protein